MYKLWEAGSRIDQPGPGTRVLEGLRGTIEMMRDYEMILGKLRRWLVPYNLTRLVV